MSNFDGLRTFGQPSTCYDVASEEYYPILSLVPRAAFEPGPVTVIGDDPIYI